MGLRVTSGLTFGPKPGAIDVRVRLVLVNLNPINDTYICISFGKRKVEMYRPELHEVRDPNMPGTND